MRRAIKVKRRFRKGGALGHSSITRTQALWDNEGGPEQKEKKGRSRSEDGENDWNVIMRAQRFWNATKIPKIEEDNDPTAIRLKMNLDLLRAASKAGNVELAGAAMDNVGNATGPYFRSKWLGIYTNPVIKESLPSLITLANGIFVLVFLRLALPRLLAMKTASDFSEIASFFGLPGKEELVDYADKAIWLVDKVFMLSEILPIAVVLPTISPLLFGGVLEGTLVTSACATVGASVNFLLGKNFLQEQVGNFSVFGSLPIKEQEWFHRLNRKVSKEPFKSALLIRLAPILPIPLDGHWYVCGVTPMTLANFVTAYFIGTLKVAFIDASLGSLLFSSILDTEAVQEQAKFVLIAEVVLVVLISAVVTNIATTFVTELTADDSAAADEGASTNANTTAEEEGPLAMSLEERIKEEGERKKDE
eukprot:jgi/Bigna1/141698/aug1.64_g16406